jgi:hypothetical protein
MRSHAKRCAPRPFAPSPLQAKRRARAFDWIQRLRLRRRPLRRARGRCLSLRRAARRGLKLSPARSIPGRPPHRLQQDSVRPHPACEDRPPAAEVPCCSGRPLTPTLLSNAPDQPCHRCCAAPARTPGSADGPGPGWSGCARRGSRLRASTRKRRSGRRIQEFMLADVVPYIPPARAVRPAAAYRRTLTDLLKGPPVPWVSGGSGDTVASRPSSIGPRVAYPLETARANTDQGDGGCPR